MKVCSHKRYWCCGILFKLFLVFLTTILVVFFKVHFCVVGCIQYVYRQMYPFSVNYNLLGFSSDCSMYLILRHRISLKVGCGLSQLDFCDLSDENSRIGFFGRFPCQSSEIGSEAEPTKMGTPLGKLCV